MKTKQPSAPKPKELREHKESTVESLKTDLVRNGIEKKVIEEKLVELEKLIDQKEGKIAELMVELDDQKSLVSLFKDSFSKNFLKKKMIKILFSNFSIFLNAISSQKY